MHCSTQRTVSLSLSLSRRRRHHRLSLFPNNNHQTPSLHAPSPTLSRPRNVPWGSDGGPIRKPSLCARRLARRPDYTVLIIRLRKITMAIIIVQVQCTEGITCSGIRFAIGGYNNMWCARTL